MTMALSDAIALIMRSQQVRRVSVQSGRSRAHCARLLTVGSQSAEQTELSSVPEQYPSPQVCGQSDVHEYGVSSCVQYPSPQVPGQSLPQLEAFSVPLQQPSPQPVAQSAAQLEQVSPGLQVVSPQLPQLAQSAQ